MQKRRRLLVESEDRSFLNYVGNSSFLPPSWGFGPTAQGNLLGTQITADKTKVLMLARGGNSLPTNELYRIRVYGLSNPSGIIEEQSDLTYLGQTASLNIEVSASFLTNIQPSLYYNESLGKIWFKSVGQLIEYDFNISDFSTSFVQYKDIPMNNGGFYFTPDGLTLYTSRLAFSANVDKRILSVPFDMSSEVSSSSMYFSQASGYLFAGIPYFYSNGNYVLYLSYGAGGASNTNLNKKSVSNPYDYFALNTMSGYRNALTRGSSYQFYNNHPGQGFLMSNDFRKINIFTASPSYTGGGTIQVATFDRPMNFRGIGNELGGVRNLNTGVVIPF